MHFAHGFMILGRLTKNVGIEKHLEIGIYGVDSERKRVSRHAEIEELKYVQ